MKRALIVLTFAYILLACGSGKDAPAEESDKPMTVEAASIEDSVATALGADHENPDTTDGSDAPKDHSGARIDSGGTQKEAKGKTHIFKPGAKSRQ